MRFADRDQRGLTVVPLDRDRAILIDLVFFQKMQFPKIPGLLQIESNINDLIFRARYEPCFFFTIVILNDNNLSVVPLHALDR